MNTTRFYLYNESRLMMLRQRRRVFLRRAFLCLAGAMCLAFAAGLVGVGA